MKTDKNLLFESAKQKVIGQNRERNGIGTLGEKTVHAVLKNYYAPDEAIQEIPIGRYVADICDGQQIIEIQTRSFNVMREKLSCFLEQYPVTIVYPIPLQKWVIWIDEETGECTKKRKSPVKGNPYMAFKELYKIRTFLGHPNLKLRFAFINMEEYRLLNGWSANKKKGSTRYDRIPTAFEAEVCLERREDYMQFVPAGLEGEFTSAEFAKEAHIKQNLAQTVLLILYDLHIVERIGKKGNNYLYTVAD